MKRLIFALLLLPFALMADEPEAPYQLCKKICITRTACTIKELASWKPRLYTSCFTSCLRKPRQTNVCFNLYEKQCGSLDSCLIDVEYGNYSRNGIK